MAASLAVNVKASQSKSDYNDGGHFKQASICFVPQLFERQLLIIKHRSYKRDKESYTKQMYSTIYMKKLIFIVSISVITYPTKAIIYSESGFYVFTKSWLSVSLGNKSNKRMLQL